MTSPAVSARADTPVVEIARLLLKNHISAVPIVDQGGAPVGMVSEGDLIGRDETERSARRDWWLGLLAEGEQLSAEFVSSLRERVASDVMSTPVVTVDEDTDTGEIARLLLAYRIKRVPVVRQGQVVGIVSRENLLRPIANQQKSEDVKAKEGVVARTLEETLAPLRWRFERPHHETETHAATPAPEPDDASSGAEGFRHLVLEYEDQQEHRREELRRSAEEEREHRAEELIGKHISEESWRNLIHRARIAAEQGQKEFQLLRFPSELCGDGGRAINAPDPEWPATLRGEAAEVYLRWKRDLKPRGFHLAARILDFPDGVPGDVGLFLVWG